MRWIKLSDLIFLCQVEWSYLNDLFILVKILHTWFLDAINTVGIDIVVICLLENLKSN